VISQCLCLLHTDRLRILFNPLLLFILGFWAAFFCYRSLDRTFPPKQRIALTYLLAIGIEHLCIGLMGFTEFDVVSGFAQIVASPQPFAFMKLVRAYLTNPSYPLRGFEYSNWPQNPPEWAWSSTVFTIVGVIAIAGAIAIARRWSVGLHIWLVVSALFLLASITNMILASTIGPLYFRGSFLLILPIGWSFSYAAAYWILRTDRHYNRSSRT
jgi:hypothetical protein